MNTLNEHTQWTQWRHTTKRYCNSLLSFAPPSKM